MELGLAIVALLALGGFGKKKPTPPGDGQQAQPESGGAPSGGGSGDTLRQIGEVGGTVGALAGTTIGILKGAGLIGGAGTATATVGTGAAVSTGAGAGGATGSGATGGATLTTATLFTGAGIGGFLVAAVVIVAVVVYEIEHAILAFNEEVVNFVRSIPAIRARAVFEGVVAKFRKDTSTLAGLRLDLPPEQIRKFALTALYLEYQSGKAANLALRKFYLWSGYDDQRMSRVTLQQSPDVSREVLAPALYEAKWLAGATGTLRQLTSQLWHNSAGQAPQLGKEIVDAPITSMAELAAAATACCGAGKLAGFVADAEFIGTANALAWASVQGYGTFYPGNETFARTLAAEMTGWPVALRALRNSKGDVVEAFWATDPKTNYSFDIAGVRAFQLNVAVDPS